MDKINVNLVKKLIKEQFPKWADLEIKPVKQSGHDNRTFHLGDEMSVRLPSAARYVPQVEKEQKWLPVLAKKLSLPISMPVAKGNPNEEYPYPWSINKWLAGETVNRENIKDLNQFAEDLAKFLVELQAVEATDGPVAGEHNFHRGGSLSVYDEETRNTLQNNKDLFDEELLTEIWELASASSWQSNPVWVHGDVAIGNLLVQDGRLRAVIDFGILGTGDPSCDAVMAWTFFDKESREKFKSTLKMDEGTWNRARGWALWKALITYDGNKNSHKKVAEEACHVIETIIDEYKLRL